MPNRPKPVVLVILDGWGHRDARENNAIAAAHIPFWDSLLRDYPHGLINASENHVGLPAGQMGNSEVGHMNIGSGRVLMQELPRIDAAIADGTLAKNPKLGEFIRKVKTGTGVCHLLGLMSDGGVHSHQKHIVALAKTLANAGIKVWVHVFSDGRDTPPKSAQGYIEWFEKETRGLDVHIATVTGRYYAMDRDKRWDRIRAAYSMIVGSDEKRPEHVSKTIDAIKQSYSKEKNSDEFIFPTAIGNFPGMQDGDGLLMANFRADRVREITQVLLDPDFKEFPRTKTIKFSAAAGMMEYSEKHKQWMQSLFLPQPLNAILGEIVAGAGLKQLRIAETEKYAHVTFFFNGGREKEFPGEERILVPSPKVATYDLKPEMSAPEMTEKLVGAINAEKFDFIVVNYANTDMVGHTGNIAAAKKAVEAVDTCLAHLTKAVLAKNGALLITADHGNAEMMHDHDSGQAHTAHTLSLVPVLLIADNLKGKKINIPEGKLADVAPTILQFLQLPQPAEMTGRSLLG
jgi:2,3-bisphosphoglycerate-independent phosphoglycerate mutase